MLRQFVAEEILVTNVEELRESRDLALIDSHGERATVDEDHGIVRNGSRSCGLLRAAV